jgi:hypothetical protein
MGLFSCARFTNDCVPALRKNTSLHAISTGINGVVAPYTTMPAFTAITRRNRYMTHLSYILEPPPPSTMLPRTSSLARTTAAGNNSTQATTPSSSTTTNTAAASPTNISLGLLTRIINVVGQGQEGASPVFMILKARLACWPELSNVDKKRKR